MKTHFKKQRNHIFGDENGYVAVFAAIATPALLMFAGLGIDFGRTYLAQERLQANVNKAALIGALTLNPQTGSTIANSSALNMLNSNTYPGLMTVDAPTISLVCSSTVKNMAAIPTNVTGCTGSDKANAVRVSQTATVPLLFASVMGGKPMKISASAMGGGNIAGNPPALNVMIVLDATRSMDSNADKTCGNITRIACAKLGIQKLLSQFSPDIDRVGLVEFPGLNSTSNTAINYCNPTGTLSSSNTAKYNAVPAPNYLVIDIGSAAGANYRTGKPLSAGLNPNSSWAKAVAYPGSGCQGVQAPGGQGTYFADAISKAQSILQKNSQSGVQNVMIVLSDGDASASTSNVSSPNNTRQCHAAVDAAKAAAASGTWVYSLFYGTGASGGCSSPADSGISACQTMQQIASDSGKFYSNDSTGVNGCLSASNKTANIADSFADLAGRMIRPRLIPSNSP